MKKNIRKIVLCCIPIFIIILIIVLCNNSIDENDNYGDIFMQLADGKFDNNSNKKLKALYLMGLVTDENGGNRRKIGENKVMEIFEKVNPEKFFQTLSKLNTWNSQTRHFDCKDLTEKYAKCANINIYYNITDLKSI